MKSKLIKTEGLIIRETPYGDGDCIFTVLTPQIGRVTVKGKSTKGKSALETTMSVGYYMNFVFYKKNSMCWVRECELAESFLNIRSNIVASALSAYIMDVAYELSEDGYDCYDILAVTYNCLYALNYKTDLEYDLIKGAFELKAMSVSGYMPTVNKCEVCSCLDTDMFLDVMNGGVICKSCMRKRANMPQQISPDDTDYHSPMNIICPLTPDVIRAMHFVICVPFSKMLSFRLEDEHEIHLFENACKTYTLNHLERDFESLKYYYSVKSKFKSQKG